MAALARIRVLLVDRCQATLALVETMLAGQRGIEVAGTAHSAARALSLVARLQPEVLCLGVGLPKEEALELLAEVLAKAPRPVLLLGARGEMDDALLAAGALDFAPLPQGGNDRHFQALAAGLAAKIAILSGVTVIHRAGGERGGMRPPQGGVPPSKVVVIGSSTGGPGALRTILGALPTKFRLPVVCVQHIGSSFQAGLVAWLSAGCTLAIEMAREGELPRPGTVYFPPEGQHLGFDGCGRFSILQIPPYHGHRPSVTVTMRSAARTFGRGATGILLTGMGDDGAEGLKEISAAGGTAIVQDEKSCVVFGMPKRAIEIGAAQRVLPLKEIPAVLAALGR
jgi:two-component system, chemotaxis family, protein-glutamate methylesterase/glutaminase